MIYLAESLNLLTSRQPTLSAYRTSFGASGEHALHTHEHYQSHFRRVSLTHLRGHMEGVAGRSANGIQGIPTATPFRPFHQTSLRNLLTGMRTC